MLSGHIREIHQILLNAVFAGDYPDRGRVDEQVGSFRYQGDRESGSSQANRGFDASEAASEHQRGLRGLGRLIRAW
jgi:hypothetical protein